MRLIFILFYSLYWFLTWQSTPGFSIRVTASFWGRNQGVADPAARAKHTWCARSARCSFVFPRRGIAFWSLIPNKHNKAKQNKRWWTVMWMLNPAIFFGTNWLPSRFSFTYGVLMSTVDTWYLQSTTKQKIQWCWTVMWMLKSFLCWLFDIFSGTN